MMRRRPLAPVAVRRGPGLIGTAARTAVVAGTATAVSGKVSRRQQEKAADQQAADQQAVNQQAAHQQQMQMTHEDSASAGGGGISEATLAKLEQLAELRKQGILTDEEFAAQKAKIVA